MHRNCFLCIGDTVETCYHSSSGAQLWFWKTAFLRPGPVGSERACVSPAVPKTVPTGRLGPLVGSAGAFGRIKLITLHLYPKEKLKTICVEAG